eukprot:3561958-Amphidinium_carterae.1
MKQGDPCACNMLGARRNPFLCTQVADATRRASGAIDNKSVIHAAKQSLSQVVHAVLGASNDTV